MCFAAANDFQVQWLPDLHWMWVENNELFCLLPSHLWVTNLNVASTVCVTDTEGYVLSVKLTCMKQQYATQQKQHVSQFFFSLFKSYFFGSQKDLSTIGHDVHSLGKSFSTLVSVVSGLQNLLQRYREAVFNINNAPFREGADKFHGGGPESKENPEG